VGVAGVAAYMYTSKALSKPKQTSDPLQFVDAVIEMTTPIPQQRVDYQQLQRAQQKQKGWGDNRNISVPLELSGIT
jgi:hypothetical protein